MFSSPMLRSLNQQENKDNVISCKQTVTNSARKPLADKSVNTKLSEKPKGTNNLSSTKPKPLKLQTPKSLDILYDYPEWCVDTYSKKDVEDTYEDILPKSFRLTDYDFIKSVQPKMTPPPKENLNIDLMVFDLPQDHMHHIEYATLEERLVEDVDIPDFDF